MPRFTILVEVEPREGFDEDWEDDDVERFNDEVLDGLSSVDVESAIADTLETYYLQAMPGSVEVTCHDARPALPKWRVQVELRGTPAKFYVEAEDKAAAKMVVQDRLGAADFVFTRTYELPWWQRI